MNSIKKIIKNISKTHGIYQFFNDKWIIIYIWKSVNLKSRVSSYFSSKTKLNFAKLKMVKQISDVKTIITNNETESLILETTLIKKHLPKYNILMKDGKNHVYIKITDDVIPKIIKTRFKNWKWEYYGPYTSIWYVNNTLKLIKKIFWYATCNIIFEKNNWIFKIKSSWNTKIPCMDFYTWTCIWPCILLNENILKYLSKIEEIKLFLKWNTKEIIKKLENKMLEKAKQLEFEQAEIIKKNIESINAIQVNQIVREWVNWDFNIINYIEKYDKYFIWFIEIRDSKITGFYNYEIKNELKEEKEEVIKNFIERKFIELKEEYIKNEKMKKYIFIIPFKLEEKINENIEIEVPKIWAKKELLEFCYKNIYEYAHKSHIDSLSTKGFTKQTMQNILDISWFNKINKSIIFECNDISHISWNFTVASRSIIENWKSNTSKYKKFKIKTLENQKIDDFGSMKEIITRRLKEIEKTWKIPDLIVIDGWKWQLSSVNKIIEDEKINSTNKDFLELLKNLQIVSIAKRDEELFVENPLNPPYQGEIENNYSSSSKEKIENCYSSPDKGRLGGVLKIVLKKDSNELRLIQKIRDEAHRFAITFNRDSRIKAMKKNILESLPWFWPKTRSKLLKKYWNVDNINNVPKNELLKLINKNQLETLENHWII